MIQLKESEGEYAFDDAIAVAEVEMGEPSNNAMVSTQDTTTVTDDSQVAPIEIETPDQP